MDVQLRDVLEDDLPIFYRHQADPVAYEMAAFPSRDETAFFAHWTSNVLANPAVTTRTILADGQVAGHVATFDRSGKREVGYWVGREYWGKGIATRALTQFLRVATERPLHAFVAKRNVASLRVLVKCGFVIAGESPAPAAAPGSPVEDWVLVLGSAAPGT